MERVRNAMCTKAELDTANSSINAFLTNERTSTAHSSAETVLSMSNDNIIGLTAQNGRDMACTALYLRIFNATGTACEAKKVRDAYSTA